MSLRRSLRNKNDNNITTLRFRNNLDKNVTIKQHVWSQVNMKWWKCIDVLAWQNGWLAMFYLYTIRNGNKENSRCIEYANF